MTMENCIGISNLALGLFKQMEWLFDRDMVDGIFFIQWELRLDDFKGYSKDKPLNWSQASGWERSRQL